MTDEVDVKVARGLAIAAASAWAVHRLGRRGEAMAPSPWVAASQARPPREPSEQQAPEEWWAPGDPEPAAADGVEVAPPDRADPVWSSWGPDPADRPSPGGWNPERPESPTDTPEPWVPQAQAPGERETQGETADGYWDPFWDQRRSPLGNAVTARLRRIAPVAGLVVLAVLTGTLVASATQPEPEPVVSLLEAPPPAVETMIEVPVSAPATPEPTAEPTPQPTPRSTPQPTARAVAAPAATPQAAGPLTVTSTVSCSGGSLTVSYELSSGAGLDWYTVYVDGSVVRGGPITGSSHSGSYTQSATPGSHDVEVTARDEDGATRADRRQANCG